MKNPHRIIAAALVLAALALAGWLYDDLPQQVPTHWNAAGEIDGTLAKPWGVLLLPLVMVGTLLVFEIVIRISPQGFRLDRSRHVVGMLVLAMLAFMLLVFGAQLRVAMGHAVDMERVVVCGVGGLLIVLGNFFGKLPKNFFIGIRTPWTLASDEVWGRTHRLAGIAFVVAGALVLLSVPFRAPHWLLPAAIAGAAIAPVVYSFLLYRRLEGFRSDNDTDTDRPV